MWYIYTIWYILPSHDKEHIWFSSNKIVEPNDYYTEWSRSERQKNKYCILIHIYMGSRKLVLINLLQGSKGDPDIGNRLVDTAGGEEGVMDWESGAETYTSPHAKLDCQWKFAVWWEELKASALWYLRGVEWDGRWEGDSWGRGHTCA